MGKTVLLVLFTIILFISSGCGGIDGRDSGTDSRDLTAAAAGQEASGGTAVEQPAGTAEAPSEAGVTGGEEAYDARSLQEAAQKYMEAINKRDLELLRTLTDPAMSERFTDSNLKAAMNAYGLYFKGLEIERYESRGLDPNAHQTVICRFFNGDGRYRDISFRYEDGSEFICTDSFLYYAGYAESLAGAFTISLSGENREALKGILTEDDLGYTAEKTDRVIEKYKKEFDLNTIGFRFTGDIDEYGGFLYEIYGKKDMADVKHTIAVIYGDGLVAIRDEWVPQAG